MCRVPALAAGEEPATAYRLHVAAAAGAGETVQGEQVPLQAQAIRGRHHTRPLRDTGNLNNSHSFFRNQSDHRIFGFKLLLVFFNFYIRFHSWLRFGSANSKIGLHYTRYGIHARDGWLFFPMIKTPMLDAMPWQYARIGRYVAWTIRPLGDTSLGRYVLGTIRPLDDKSLVRFALERYVLWTIVLWIVYSSNIRPIYRLLS